MKKSNTFSSYLGAIGLVALATLVCEMVRTLLVPTNMVMAYLLVVVVAAVRLGLKPAILTAFLSVIAFDVLFVPPRFSLRVSDSEYLVTFFALFVVGVVISALVAKIQEKAEQIKKQEERTNSLYCLTRDLSASVDLYAIEGALQRNVLRSGISRLSLVLSPEGLQEKPDCRNGIELDTVSKDIIRWVFRSGRFAGGGTAAFPEYPYLFVPVKSGGRVLVIMVVDGSGSSLTNDLQLLETFAGQTAMALERIQLSRQAEEARIQLNKTHLEQALLNSISHDFRTPLVTISGVLDTLRDTDTWMDSGKRDGMLSIASEEADRLNRFVGSLLDITRLEAGALVPRLAECDIDELVGCAVGAVELRDVDHQIVTSVDPDLPPVQGDLVLLTQALVNLLENALKYTPKSCEISLSASQSGARIHIVVCDGGPGIPAGEEERIFDKFHRVAVPEKSGGTGLGLSIAKGIIEAHHGTISASNRKQGGLMVDVVLPVPPQIPVSEDSQ